MRALCFLVFTFCVFLFTLASCGFFDSDSPACDPSDYAAAVSAAYAKRAGACDDFATVDECPAFHEAKAEVARMHPRFVQCGR